ncbi:hypothetical protein D6764_05115, partial [Candidatus Woesearchaeota archaeon]
MENEQMAGILEGKGFRFLIGIIILLIFFGKKLVMLATDWMWFRSVGYESIFEITLATKIILFSTAFILTALFCWANARYALKHSGTRNSGKIARSVWIVFSLLIAFFMSSAWKSIL